jgi:hypothetical protein
MLSLGVAILALSAVAFAQRGMKGGPAHDNPATEVTLKGTVDEVKQISSQGKGPGGLHLILSTEPKPIEVLLGPAWYVSSKNFTFAKGDAVTVTGSKMTIDNSEVVVAREIKKGQEVLTLRDANGFPLWPDAVVPS